MNFKFNRNNFLKGVITLGTDKYFSLNFFGF